MADKYTERVNQLTKQMNDAYEKAQSLSEMVKPVSNIITQKTSKSNPAPRREPEQRVSLPYNTNNVQNARQAMMFQPAQDQQRRNWHIDQNSTTSEVLARIYDISRTDRQKANELYNTFSAYQQQPGSAWYSPYKQATNPAIAEIAALGIDVSGGINEKWFQDNAWLKNEYRLGSSGSPLAPAKKSSNAQDAAYWYDHILDAEQTTQAAEKEWAALQEEVKYWANRKDRNYSDDDILNKIDWKQYKTLQKMDEATGTLGDGQPTFLNRPIGYTKDNLKGVIWAARNNGSTGDPFADATQYVLGNGNKYQANEEISRKLDPASEYYSPYSAGSTLDDAALYFGVDRFGKDWLDKNRAYLNNGNETDKKMYNAVYKAEQTTLQAEEEANYLRSQMNDLLGKCSDPERVLKSLKNDLSDLPMLQRMDESMISGGDLVGTTRAVGYSWNDIEREVRRRCDEMNSAQQTGDFVADTKHLFTPVTLQNDPKDSIYHKAQSNEANATTRDNNINAAGIMINDLGTPEEKVVFTTAYNGDFESYSSEISRMLKDGEIDTGTAYKAMMSVANAEAAKAYPDARKTVQQYEELQRTLEENQKKIDEIMAGAPQESEEEPKQKGSHVGLVGISAGSGYSDAKRTAPANDNSYSRHDNTGIGQFGRGNIDLYNRTPYDNGDGSISTVDSFSVNLDGKEVLLPTIIDGKRYSEDDAIEHYERTGEYLGIFDTPEEADAYAELLHEQQEQLYTSPESAGASDAPMKAPSVLRPQNLESRLHTSDNSAPKTEAERIDFNNWARLEDNVPPGAITPENEAMYYAKWREDRGITDGKNQDYINSLDDKTRAELYAAQAAVEEITSRMADMQPSYDDASKQLQEIDEEYAAATQMRDLLGSDAVDISQKPQLEMLADIGNHPVQVQHSQYTAYDAMRQQGKSQSEIRQAAKNAKEQLTSELNAIQEAMEQVGPSMTVSGEFKRNIEGTIAMYEREIQAADYVLMQDEKGFAQQADAAKARIKDAYESRSLFADRKGFTKLDLAVADPTNLNLLMADTSGPWDYAGFMTDEERNTYLYLRETQGKAAAKDYFDYLSNDTYGVLQVRQSMEMQKNIRAATEQAPWLMNIVDVLASPTRAVGGIYSMYQYLTGQDINPYSQYYATNTANSIITSVTNDKLEKEFGEGTFGTKVAQLGYGVVKSAAESGWSAMVFGGVNLGSEAAKTALGKFGLKATEAFISAAPMGMGAMGSTVQEVIQNGGSIEQAMGMGAVTFLAETVSEAVSIDNILDAFKGGAEGTKGFLKTVLESAVMEGSEEIFGGIAEQIADDQIMGELSKREQLKDQYISAGYDPDTAEKMAARDIFKDILMDGLSGALSGGLSTGVSYGAGAAANAVTTNRAGRGTSNTDVQRQNRIGQNVNEQAAAEAVQENTAVQPAAQEEAEGTPHENRNGQRINEQAAEAAVQDQGEAAPEEAAAPVEPAPASEAPAAPAAETPAQEQQDSERHDSLRGLKNDVTVLTQSLKADEASQTASVAAVLTPTDGAQQAASYASAAAQHIGAELGTKKAAKLVRGILLQTANNIEGGFTAVKNAIVTAGLNAGGRAHAALQNMAENGVTLEGIRSMISAATAESADPNAVTRMQNTVIDNMVAQRETQLIADGALNGLHSYEVSNDQAQLKLSNAKDMLSQAQKKLKTLGRNLQSLVAQLNQDPGNIKLGGQLTQANKDLQGQREVVHEYEQSVANAQAAANATQETLDMQREQAMKDLRNQAMQDVMTAQEQAAIQQQELAQAADEQRQDRNSNTLSAENFIDEMYPDATEEEKAVIRNRVEQMQQEAQDPEKIKSREQFAKNLSKKFGINIEVADTTQGGTQQRYNGSYNESTNTITIDKAASQSDLIYAVALHELTHMAERSGMYDQLATALTRMAYTNADGTYNETQLANDIKARQQMYNSRLALMQQTDASVDATPLTAEQASKEIVADLTRRVLFGDEAAIQSLVASDEGVARRFLNGIKNFLRRLVGIDDPSVVQLQKTQKLFEDALKDAQKNLGNTGNGRVQYSLNQSEDVNTSEGTIKNSSGETIAEEFRGGTVSKQYSLSSWTPQERSTVRQNLLNKGFAEADVDKWISDVDSTAAMIAADKSRLDYTADPGKTMLKPNAEYVKTLDASTLCAKRLLYQGTFNEIQHLLPNTPLTPTDLIDLVNMMKDAGYETPCGICYVESRRRHLGNFAEGWLQTYEGSYKPSLDEVTTTDGLEALRKDHPDTYKDFIDAMNSKGSNNPKVVQLRTDYRGEIRDMTKGQKEKVVEIGGLRVQSFSDFETPHLIDMMQAVLDMSAEGLTSQAYTKVPNFAWAFGDTGIKINLSLIGDGNGLDANGNLLFSSTEGMDFNEAMRLRDRYSENVGTILVGMNDAHILAAMADDRIDFIIPFHKSGWSQQELQNVRGMNVYDDYTDEQNEREITGYTKKGEPKYKNVKQNLEPVGPNGYWDFSKSGKENAEAYLKLCAEQGRIPKFSRFLVDNGDGSFSLKPDGSTDGYWKTLIDFKMYDNDGNGAPQRAVTPNVNMDEAVRILNEYEGGADSLPVAQDIVDEYVSKYKAEHPREQYSLPSPDILDEQIRQYLSGSYGAFGRQLPATTNQLATQTQNTKGMRYMRGGSTQQQQQQGASSAQATVSPYQSAINLADKLGIGHSIGTKKMNNLPRSVRGYYQQQVQNLAVRSSDAGNYQVTMHEIFHHLGEKYGMAGTPEMINNLPALFSDAYSPAELADESFAEFGWRWIMGDDAARSFAGDDFVDEFESNLRKNGDYSALAQARGEVQAFLNSTLSDRLHAVVHNKSDVNKNNGGIRKFFSSMLDDSSAAETLNHKIREQNGGKVDFNSDVRANALMKNFSSRHAWSILTENLTDSDKTIIGDGLATRFDDAGIEANDIPLLEEYMLLKHSMDRDAQGKPVFDYGTFPTGGKEARIAEIEAKHPNIVAGLKAFEDFRTEFMQSWLVDTGFLTQESFDKMQEMYPNYVPTQRVMDNAGRGNRGGNKQTYQIRRATGGTQDIISPIDSFVDMVNSVVTMVNANKAAQAFDAAYQQYKGMGEFARDVTQDMQKVSVDTTELQKKVSDLLSGEVSDDIFQEVIAAIGTEQSQWNGTGNVNLPNVLTVQRADGSKAFYEIYDTELYKLLASQRDNNAGPLFQQVAKLTRAMSALTTGSNPVFAIRNFMRDFQNSVNYGSWASNYLSGGAKWLRSAYDVWRNKGDYADYVALGGGGWNRIDTGTKKGSEDYRSALFKGYDTKDAAHTARYAGKKIWNAITLARLNEIVEQTSRYAEYKFGQHDKSTAEGRQQAFLASQEATVDFARSGNSQLAANLKAIIPFLGASSQGVYRTGRMLTEAERGRAPARFTKTVVNTALASAICAALTLKFSSDDDKEAFANMSDGLKSQHFYLPNFFPEILGNQSLIRIPVAQDPLMYAIHGAVTNAIWNGSTDGLVIDLAATANTIVGNLNPVSSTVFDPLISMKTNINWYGSRIVPSRMDGWDPSTQYTEETPDAFVGLGRATGVSPLKLQYLAEQYTGFLGQMLIPALSKDRNTGELGGVKAAVSAARKRLTSDPLVSNDIVGSFYDGSNLITEVSKAKNERPMNMLRRGLTPKEAGQAYAEAKAMLAKGGIIYETKAFIGECYSKIDQINANESLTEQQKYTLASDVRREMIQAALDAQEEIGAFNEKYVTGKNIVTSMLYEGTYAYLPSAYDNMDTAFKTEENAAYMQRAMSVYNSSGKDSALPHPAESFKYTPKGGKQQEYVIDQLDWDNYVEVYKRAYEKHVMDEKGWDDLDAEERYTVLTAAHRKASDAAKAWYIKLLSIK